MRDKNSCPGKEWVVWERQAQIWASFLRLRVKAPNCGARSERLAAREMVSNIQLLWSAGEMKNFGFWQMLQLQGSVAASLGRVEDTGEGMQALQRDSHQRKSLLHRGAVRGCGKNHGPRILRILRMGLSPNGSGHMQRALRWSHKSAACLWPCSPFPK